MIKKIMALLFTALLIFAAVSCEETVSTTSSDQTATESTSSTEATTSGQGTAAVDETTLVSGVGLADPDGVYVVPDGITFINEGAFANDTTLKKVVMPSSVKGIGAGAFYGCTYLKEVVMTDGVTSIGASAFAGCMSLTEIDISKGLTELLPYTFYYCRALEEITLPSGMKSVGSYCFAGCTALYEVDFNEALESVGTSAFAACSSLRKLTGFENTSLTAIGDSAFMQCVALKRVELPATVTAVGLGSFIYCSNLTDVVIPSGVTYIGMMAFTATPWYSENTDKFFIVGDGVLIKSTFNPNSAEEAGTLDLTGLGIKSIGHSCFANASSSSVSSSDGYQFCGNIKYVVIPEGVTDVGSSAFYECTNIKKVSLPSTLESIGSSAFFSGSDGVFMNAEISFDKCTSLKAIGNEAFSNNAGIEDVVLPASVEQIGANAFTGTAAHYKFMDDSLAESATENKFKIVGDGILLWVYVAKDSTAVNIPSGVKYIASNACAGWDSGVVYTDFETTGETELIKVKHRLTYNVKTLTIPEGVTAIGDNAFLRMSSLSSVVIPDSVVTLGSDAFYMCGGITSVKLGKNLETIGSGAFELVSMKEIDIPASVKSIGAKAFAECAYLVSLTIPTTVETLGFSIVDSECTALKTVELPMKFRPQILLIVAVQRDDVQLRYYGGK